MHAMYLQRVTDETSIPKNPHNEKQTVKNVLFGILHSEYVLKETSRCRTELRNIYFNTQSRMQQTYKRRIIYVVSIAHI